ncbi:hypothetical protein CYLTODRAFT_409104 [Cylindrobasidium torrendii FP15055 ss-10]|uniref:HMG box domain-containing protein n=1 Tax=Cylindrobasidium torrendii FP15055 ss-10 TaxID=1314674 RepID=A0A0D7BJB7_9AGAR|nr:hypothetical protein CYLTODRAFT_409104 [Cylindrobasidium torrendii FP15055 ss-10]
MTPTTNARRNPHKTAMARNKHTAPKKNSHRKKRPSGYITRPPNCFILFRQHFAENHIKPQDPKAKAPRQATISKEASVRWGNLSLEEKSVWREKQDEVAAAHKLEFPNYKFTPAKKRSRVDDADDSDFEVETTARRTRKRARYSPRPSTSEPTPMVSFSSEGGSSSPPSQWAPPQFPSPSTSTGNLPEYDSDSSPSISGRHLQPTSCLTDPCSIMGLGDMEDHLLPYRPLLTNANFEYLDSSSSYSNADAHDFDNFLSVNHEPHPTSCPTYLSSEPFGLFDGMESSHTITDNSEGWNEYVLPVPDLLYDFEV